MLKFKNRRDTYFSQKVRNLKSHDTLTRYGYANYIDGIYQITSAGRTLVNDNIENINYILSSEFDYNDVKTIFGEVYELRNTKIIPYNEIITEGSSKYVTIKTHERSSKLRNAAIDYFSKNGIISCDCCGFEFKTYYGEKYGVSCIEIHHLKPIFQYAGVSEEITIQKALNNLLPVCPNCHRVIHKIGITADKIIDFKQQITLRRS